MNELKYKFLESYHASYIKDNPRKNVEAFSVFKELMENDFSGENIKRKVIDPNPLWAKMLSSRGFGRSKMEHAERYRANIIEVWNDISELVDSNESEGIYHAYAKYSWGLKEGEYQPNAFGIVASLILQNKLWKHPNMTDIFVHYFGFMLNESLSIDELAERTTLTRERVRQLKNKCIKEFEITFSFFREPYFRSEFDNYFTELDFSRENVKQFKDEVNRKYGVSFSIEFYTKIIALIYGLHTVGNLNDVMSQNSNSSTRNIWSDIYLQTDEQIKKFNFEAFVDFVAAFNYKNNGYYKDDISLSLGDYLEAPLSVEEIEFYGTILKNEFDDFDIVLLAEEAIIKRNSYVSKHEYVEKVLTDLGGLEYVDTIVRELNKQYPSIDKWDEEIVRSNTLRQSQFYTVGKSGLYGLKSVKDVRQIAGDGTLNDIMKLHLESKDDPVHIFDLLENINQIFPRKKTLHSVHSILEQDSRDMFEKLPGGFYGLKNKTYINKSFPQIKGYHGRALRSEIRNSGALTRDQLLNKLNSRYGLLPVQLDYLLYQAIESEDVRLVDNTYEIYHHNETEDNDPTGLDDFSESIYEEVNDHDFEDDSIQDSEYTTDPLIQVKIRRGQPRFRKALMHLYSSTCILSSCKITPLLEAAHIMPHHKGANYSMSNGILMRSDLHTLFDSDLLAINPDTLRIHIHPLLSKDEMYKQFDNIDLALRVQELHRNYYLNKEGLKWRWNAFKESL
ncbi:HNH endonuclease [Gilvibacter sp.]|uniref:HNH endonuclease n=1 Tax=Gilvibacter sp. TaxID=2729997 RepID=UPI003B5281C6